MNRFNADGTPNIAATPFRFTQSKIVLEKAPDGLEPMFSKAKIYVLYKDKNRNGSIFTDEFVNTYIIPTLVGAPIVGEFFEEKGDFGSHGGKIVLSDQGVEFIVTTKPYGFVPESAEITWEKVTEKDGTVNDYLVTSGILWTGKYPEVYRTIENTNNQSLELNPDTVEGLWEEHEVEGRTEKIPYFRYTKGQLSALCILGQDIEPCFESAKITSFSHLSKEEDVNYTELLKEMTRAYSLFAASSSSIVVDNDIKQKISAERLSEASFFQKISQDKNCNFLAAEAYFLAGEDYATDKNSRKFLHHAFAEDGKMVLDSTLLNKAAKIISSNPNKYQKDLPKMKEHFKKHGVNPSIFEQGGSKTLKDLKAIFEAINVFDAESNSYKHDLSVVSFTEQEDKSLNVIATDTKTWFAIQLNEDMSIATKEETTAPVFDLTEYEEAKTKLAEVEAEFAATKETLAELQSKATTMETEFAALAEFKAAVETEKKQGLLEKFATILTSEEVESFTEKMGEFSYEDLEAKLALSAVRNQAVFSKLTGTTENDPQKGSFDLGGLGNEGSFPSWAKLVK